MTTETDAAASLRAVLAVIDRGEVDATSTDRAYLAGAADALGRLACPCEPDPPFTLNDRLP
jgi:hypothetical protein